MMATRSKWQQLATEAVNPRSRGIDTLSPGEMVEVMVVDGRAVLAAVQHERHASPAARNHRRCHARRRPVDLRRGRHERTSRRARSGGVASHLRHRTVLRPRRSWLEVRRPCTARKKAWKTTTTKALAPWRAFDPAARRRDRHLGERHHPVRARRCRAWTCRGRARHRHHLRSAFCAEETCGGHHCAERGPRGHRGVDPAEGRNGHQGRAEHADDDRHGAGGEDLWESDGGREVEFRKAARSGAPHCRRA